MEPWRVLHTRYLLKRWWMNLRVDRVQLPDGTEIEEFHVVEYPDWACVVCLDREGHLVLVRQYRHGIGRTLLECPAGAVGPAEEPLAAAQRELLEETGYAAEEWIYLGRCAPEPSKHTNYAHLFVARGARPVQPPQLDHTEDLSVHRVPIEEAFRQAEDGDLAHGIHLTALFWARQRGLLE